MRSRTIVRTLGTTIVLGAASLAAAATAWGSPPAAFTTNSDGTAVNANHYQDKCDVYLDGGPIGATEGDGDYVFFQLAPSGQADPNGPELLATDANANRTFTISGGNVVYTGTHPVSTDVLTGQALIDLCDPSYPDNGYADTPNGGGVYIVAICPAANQTPSACKYDMFKVVGSTPPSGGTDLVATKTAAGSFTRTYTWTTSKSVDKSTVSTSGNTVTANYTVGVTKSAPSDSNFVVSGEVTVFNPNDGTVSGVAVSDSIGTTTCTVTGGSDTIEAGGSAVFDYSCALTGATATDTGTNTADVTWDAASISSPDATATATAPYDFTAPPTVVGNCTTVSDTLKGTLGTVCASQTFSYPLTLSVPAAGCQTFPNTASESASGSSASAAVTLCRLNSNGYTMGFWQNKNGQAKITGSHAGICTFLAHYPNVLTLPSPCTAKALAGYVTSVISAANASGTGAAMFKGQFLATALSAYFSPALANTGIAVSPALFGNSCLTVSQLLAFGNANYATLSGNKANFMAVKSVYDAINNDQALTC